MTAKEILEEVLSSISLQNRMFICNAIDDVSSCKTAKELKVHFNNPSNIPEEYRGLNWIGDRVSGLWLATAKEERIDYLKHLISKL
jgi:hypothetical protein